METDFDSNSSNINKMMTSIEFSFGKYESRKDDMLKIEKHQEPHVIDSDIWKQLSEEGFEGNLETKSQQGAKWQQPSRVL